MKDHWSMGAAWGTAIVLCVAACDSSPGTYNPSFGEVVREFIPEPKAAGYLDDLKASLGKADRIVFVKKAIDLHAPSEIVVKDPRAVTAFIDELELAEKQEWSVCACSVNYNMQFYKGPKQIGTIVLPTENRVSWYDGNWPGEAVLSVKSTEKLQKWLKANAPDLEMGW